MTSTCQMKIAFRQSSQGRPIDLYASNDFKWTKDEKPLLLVGGVHGDEPEGVWLAEYTLELLKNTNPKKITRPWLLIPCINPDGFAHNLRVNGNGVDLNRNFPAKNWSAEYTKPRYFPGPHPGSEIETKTMVEIIENFKPSLMLHYHSWNPMIVYTGTPAKEDAKILAATSGLELKEDIGYPTPGSLGDYGWLDKKIPVICVEVQEKTNNRLAIVSSMGPAIENFLTRKL